MNTEPMPAGLEALYADLQQKIDAMRKPVNPLADATPAPWATASHEPVEL